MTTDTISLPQLSIVVAIDKAGGIGLNNQLPWRLPEDLAHFKRVTSGHAILMGRKTYDSIGRPLPNRRNIVITRNAQWAAEGVQTADSLTAALRLSAGSPAYIIGGAQIFAESMDMVDQLIVTEIDKTFECDTFFPAIDKDKWVETARELHYSETNACDYAFVTYTRKT
ncbi:dihydrofolate reductase [Zemynaea arenosa]|uniref:dihydrofolate reductase n=1 Tax=Zemynaea arenosa TaxID=2561931 RepID=UPI001E5735D0|nr:dihydrofolate reductase [Massilia arenosa]